MSSRLTQVAAVAVAIGGLYALGSVSSVLTEQQPPEPKASRVLTAKDGGRSATLIDAWTMPRADAPVAGRAGWRLLPPDQRDQTQPRKCSH